MHVWQVVGSAFSHISKPLRFRPVLRQHLPTPVVDLHLPHNSHSGAFETEVETADTGKQAANCQTHRKGDVGRGAEGCAAAPACRLPCACTCEQVLKPGHCLGTQKLRQKRHDCGHEQKHEIAHY
jgi:hypothetical protein